jgi:type VI secretion system Hcp family effector
MELFMRIEGQSGPVTTPASRNGWFRAASFDWGGMQADLDATTGSVLRHRHRPFAITRTIDGASPFLLDALTHNSQMNLTLGIDAPDPRGAVRGVATYILKAAALAEYRLTAINGGADAVTEQLSFTYNAIEVQHDPSAAKYQNPFAGS